MEHVISESGLVRLADLNMVQYWCDSANWVPGSEILLQRDTVMIDCALNVPACSSVFNLAETWAGEPAEFIARAKTFFTGRKKYFSLFLRAHRDHAIIEYCRENKFFELNEQPGMVLDAPLKNGPLPGGAKLNWVEDARGVQDFGTVVAEAYLDLDFPVESSRGYFANAERVISPHMFLAVVYLEGEPACTAMAMLSHGIAGIYWVGTVKKARGKGLAEYCVREVCNKAFSLGAGKVILQASKFGEPVYLRMGFREFTRYPWFICSSK
jgi:GNAT superfamily N-acetyltransferase